MQTTFTDRDQLVQYLRQQFPGATGRGDEISPTRGGRSAAEALLRQIEPERYTTTRNMLAGSVTHLSPYLRHGVLSLAEVRRYIQGQYTGQKSNKLLQELAWRDYYQRVYARLQEAIWLDIEAYKTGVEHYEQELPQDITQGKTGLNCIDTFSHNLRTTGYLHNHARLWTAAYVVHHRRIRWQAGAYWFLQHLLDGDPASNNLSWQWVTSTFAAKPYYFNRENLAHYTENLYCNTCPLLHNGCPFAGTYEEVQAKIFPNMPVEQSIQSELTQYLANTQHQSAQQQQAITPSRETIVWLNEECLDPHGPALKAHPASTPVFVFDKVAIEKAGWTLKRIAFLYECLLEIPDVQIYYGEPVEILCELVENQRKKSNDNINIATTQAIEPRLKQQIKKLAEHIPIQEYAPEPFASIEVKDLRRFSRYWHLIKHEIIGNN